MIGNKRFRLIVAGNVTWNINFALPKDDIEYGGHKKNKFTFRIVLISLMKWSEIIFQNQLNQYQKEIDIVLRRGGRLQDHILFHNTRWKESD